MSTWSIVAIWAGGTAVISFAIAFKEGLRCAQRNRGFYYHKEQKNCLCKDCIKRKKRTIGGRLKMFFLTIRKAIVEIDWAEMIIPNGMLVAMSPILIPACTIAFPLAYVIDAKIREDTNKWLDEDIYPYTDRFLRGKSVSVSANGKFAEIFLITLAVNLGFVWLTKAGATPDDLVTYGAFQIFGALLAYLSYRSLNSIFTRIAEKLFSIPTRLFKVVGNGLRGRKNENALLRRDLATSLAKYQEIEFPKVDKAIADMAAKISTLETEQSSMEGYHRQATENEKFHRLIPDLEEQITALVQTIERAKGEKTRLEEARKALQDIILQVKAQIGEYDLAREMEEQLRKSKQVSQETTDEIIGLIKESWQRLVTCSEDVRQICDTSLIQLDGAVDFSPDRFLSEVNLSESAIQAAVITPARQAERRQEAQAA